MEYKYTADGKKVRVVEELNNKEYVVQEIVIVNGEEVAAISNFTVKDLYNESTITWKNKHIEELEALYNRKEEDCKKKIKDIFKMEEDLTEKISRLQYRLDYADKVFDKANKHTLDTLIDFLSGNIKWIVTNDKFPALLEWSKNEIQYGKVRIVSLFGDNNGTFQYGINKYAGYYEVDNIYFIPFTNYEDAFAKFKELVLDARISKELIVCAKKYDIQLDTDKVAKWKEEQLQIYLENIKLCDEKIIANNKAIDKLSNL